MNNIYDHKDIEGKWQKRWADEGVYRVLEKLSGKKAYVLDMFPYISGAGIHVGHPKGYIATDIYSRMKRMQGYSVLHPMGWDAFGLPAENYAIKTKTNPKDAVAEHIVRFKEQLSILGFDYDWDREINTTDPDFYKWTQWIFLKLYEKGLAFQSYEPINWCPSCLTGLANEDVESDGTCERCGTKVEKKPMRQWVLKITDYADRLLEDLELLPNWPESIKESQRNWIGRSEGAHIEFEIKGRDKKIKVFTTRPDTLFGATYMVLAPEHSLVHELTHEVDNQDEVNLYIEKTNQKTEIERTAEGKEKTGVELKGIKAVNPANKEEIPVFIADYVLNTYGTGAIMAVPAHDERDYEFACTFDIPIKQVIAPVVLGEGEYCPRSENNIVKTRAVSAVIKHWNDDSYYVVHFSETDDGLVGGKVEQGETLEEAVRREVREETGYSDITLAKEVMEYSFARVYKPRKDQEELCADSLFYIEIGSDKKGEIVDQETTSGSWMTKEEIFKKGKFSNHHANLFELGLNGGVFSGYGKLVNSGEFDGLTSEEAKEKITKAVGGEMTVNYRLQDWVFSRQRYWGEPIPVIHCEKCGVVPVPEKDLPVTLPDVEHYEPTGTGESPLANIDEWVNVSCPTCGGEGKRETNTMPQWAGSSWYWLRYMDPKNEHELVDKETEKFWSPVDLYVGGAEHATRHLIYARFWHKFLYDIGVVSEKEPFKELHSVGLIQAEDGRKMSKRWGNVINPDDIVETFGADSLRVYEMFMGPFENAIAWSTNGLVGARKFIEKVWKTYGLVEDSDVEALEPELHKTIKKVSDDIEEFKFNTAISQMMIFINKVNDEKSIGKNQFMRFLKVLAPFAPHVSEELWKQCGGGFSIHQEEWPEYEAGMLVSETVTIAVQINGKMRGVVETSSEAKEGEVIDLAKNDEKIAKYLDFEPKKVIFVPGKVLNIIG